MDHKSDVFAVASRGSNLRCFIRLLYFEMHLQDALDATMWSRQCDEGSCMQHCNRCSVSYSDPRTHVQCRWSRWLATVIASLGRWRIRSLATPGGTWS